MASAKLRACLSGVVYENDGLALEGFEGSFSVATIVHGVLRGRRSTPELSLQGFASASLSLSSILANPRSVNTLKMLTQKPIKPRPSR